MTSATNKRALRSAPRRPGAQQTELSLLRTATWLFSERGFHGTGIRDIADAAGTAVSGMYYYASSKDDLLESIMRMSLNTLTTGARQALDGQESPVTRLVTLVGTHVIFHTTNPRSARVTDHEFRAISGRRRREILELRDGYESIWSDVLDSGARAGVFLDRGPVARFGLLQMTTGVAHWYSPRGALTPAQLWMQFADLALAMLDPRTGPALSTADLTLPDPATIRALVRMESEPHGRPRNT